VANTFGTEIIIFDVSDRNSSLFSELILSEFEKYFEIHCIESFQYQSKPQKVLAPVIKA